MHRVLVTPHPLNRTPGRYSEILRAAGCEIVYPPPGQPLKDNVAMLLADRSIRAILASMEPLSREVLPKTGLRVIARMGVGFDAVDIPTATELGIAVAITPGCLEESVAEQTLALLLAVYRNIVVHDRNVRQGKWPRLSGPRLAGKTLGLVGLGRIGKAVVPKARGLGLKVIASDPFPDAVFAAANDVRYVPLEELLRTADIVSLHSPNTPETVDLINRESLAKMKRGSVLINTARGALVDEDALCEALRSGHLLGAGLDVFKVEPLPTGSPLLQFDNVVVCEHMGGLDQPAQEAMAALAAQNIADLLQGRWPERCVVNPEVRAKWEQGLGMRNEG